MNSVLYDVIQPDIFHSFEHVAEESRARNFASSHDENFFVSPGLYRGRQFDDADVSLDNFRHFERHMAYAQLDDILKDSCVEFVHDYLRISSAFPVQLYFKAL